MAFKFSSKSLNKLAGCHPDLQRILLELIKHSDFTILCSIRTKHEQDEAVRTKASKLAWPNSLHNLKPGRNSQYSLAVDLAPFPIVWEDREGFCLLAGRFLQIAAQFNTPVRWGGDWNKNNKTKDEKFSDMPHFELVGITEEENG